LSSKYLEEKHLRIFKLKDNSAVREFIGLQRNYYNTEVLGPKLVGSKKLQNILNNALPKKVKRNLTLSHKITGPLTSTKKSKKFLPMLMVGSTIKKIGKDILTSTVRIQNQKYNFKLELENPGAFPDYIYTKAIVLELDGHYVLAIDLRARRPLNYKRYCQDYKIKMERKIQREIKKIPREIKKITQTTKDLDKIKQHLRHMFIMDIAEFFIKLDRRFCDVHKRTSINFRSVYEVESQDCLNTSTQIKNYINILNDVKHFFPPEELSSFMYLSQDI